MSSVTQARCEVDVVIGVDTHVETHAAAVLDAHNGAVLVQVEVPATPAGYAELVARVQGHGPVGAVRRVWAVEGTGSHGAGLARHLAACGEVVVELDRPERLARRHGAKTDPLDAVRAAREALARPRWGAPRAAGERQALSVLMAARGSAVQGAGDAARQLFALVIAAPDPVRARFAGQNLAAMIITAARIRVPASADTETTSTLMVLRSLARRAQALNDEAALHHKAISTIVASWRPDLLAEPGIGPIVAATVLCAWSHPGRIHSEAAFAMLAGAAPIPASSGQTTRHRLNRRGDRQLNRALHTIVLSRLRHHEPTIAYATRRRSEGKTTREIRRCLKRYVIRDLYRQLEKPPTTP